MTCPSDDCQFGGKTKLGSMTHREVEQIPKGSQTPDSKIPKSQVEDSRGKASPGTQFKNQKAQY